MKKAKKGRSWRELLPREAGIAQGAAHVYGEFAALSDAGGADWARGQMRAAASVADDMRIVPPIAAPRLSAEPKRPSTRDCFSDFTDGFVAGAAWAAANLLGGTPALQAALVLEVSGSHPPNTCPQCGGVYGELAAEGGCRCDST
jgi:hypothetical protein